MHAKQALRQKIRTQRQHLSPKAQYLASKLMSRNLLSLPAINKAKHIALYWPSDGEISPLFLLRHLRQQQKTLYLPTILQTGHIAFRVFNSCRALQDNQFGIPEPVNSHYLPAHQLDIVLMPLVAFDKHGNRLGMGGGYYDRTFAFKKEMRWRKKPLLIGLAYDFQEVPALESDSWDIPLTAVVTNKKVIPILKHTA